MENTETVVDYTSHVETQITEIITNKAWWTGTFDKIDRTIRQLEKLVCSTEGGIDSILQANRILETVTQDSLKMMNDGYCRWETEVENQFAHQVLTKPGTRIEDYLLYERFVRLLTKELELIGDTNFNSIIFIGSGPFPITAILLHKLTGKKVDCLELHGESADISRKVLKRLGLSDVIQVHEGNGSTFDLSSYDIVLAALLAKPKSRILQNVLTSGKPEAKILCRTSEGLRKLLYEPTLRDAYKGFNIHASQNAGYDDTISTILLSSDKIAPQNLEFSWLERITDAELQLLVQMCNSIIADDNNNGFTDERNLDDYYFTQLRNDINAGVKRLMVIKDRQRYYGQMVINLFHQDTYSHRADVCSLMLHKSVRSKEVSLQVAQQLIDECKQLDLELITMDVRAGSAQEKLWRYLGFVPYGDLPKYSKVGDHTYAGVFFFQEVKQLQELLKRRLEAMYTN